MLTDTELLTICTCDSWWCANASAHSTYCSLLDDVDFCNGDAKWDGSCASLVYEPRDDFEDLDDILADGEPLDELEEVLDKLYGADIPEGMYDKCIDYIGIELLDAFDRLGGGDDMTDADMDEIEMFAMRLHLLTKDDSPPYYDCLCAHSNHLACGACGILRAKTGQPWMPTRKRRLHEIELLITGGLYKCECTPPKKFACADCGVQRWSSDSAWTYWDATQIGVYADSNGKVHTTAGQYSASGNGFADVDDFEYQWGGGWGGTGIATVYQKCRHYGQDVKLPDGTMIVCSSEFKRKGDDDEAAPPDFGCYMYSGWEPDWLAYWLNWTDYGLPKMSTDTVEKIVDDLLVRARAGQRVEIGCMGGHGRTGTLLALLALKAGASCAADAKKLVWRDYCNHAIEGDIQEWYVEAFDARLKGQPTPPKPVTPCSTWQHEQMFKKGERCTKGCSNEQKHYDTWVADEKKKAEKAATSSPKAWVKSSSKVVSTPSSASSTAGSDPHGIYAPVDWNTPVPERDDDGMEGEVEKWCSSRRHVILWWRRDECDCKYWDSDVAIFKTRKTPQATAKEVLAHVLTIVKGD